MKKLMSFAAICTLSSGVMAAKSNTSIYGYVEGYVEKVEKTPTRSGGNGTTEGQVTRVENAHEFQTPNVKFMVKNTTGKYSSFLNIDASEDSVTMSNAWVESKLKGDYLKARIGKMYRKFGLYNERLDAVPTYIGIEAPELFDGDHLLLTRTTNFMFHGEKDLGEGTLYYSLSTGNDERAGSEIPLGGDVRYTLYGDDFEWTLGTSFYLSHKAAPSKGDEEGSPDGGVLNWMAEDKYEVLGFYTELKRKALTFQFAYYQADHDAIRDAAKVQKIQTTGLNDRQLARFCDGAAIATCTTNTSVNYKVKTWYVRTGYSIMTKSGEWTPYIQWDYYENPETIAYKKDGGDKEAGLADDGKFTKQTIGVVYKPNDSLALKLDASNHEQDIDGETVNYAEVRGSFSYVWQLL